MRLFTHLDYRVWHFNSQGTIVTLCDYRRIIFASNCHLNLGLCARDLGGVAANDSDFGGKMPRFTGGGWSQETSNSGNGLPALQGVISWSKLKLGS
jgi:hypothetical protein